VTLENLRAKLRREGRLILEIKAIPKSSKDEIVEGAAVLKVKVTAAPEKGKANAAIVDLLAHAFGVPKRNVQVLRGETSSQKTVEILL
jgi:uncharacterized protein